MTQTQKEATKVMLDSFRELPLVLQLIVAFIAVGGLPTATQLVTLSPRVATLEAQQDTMRQAQAQTAADVARTEARIDSLIPLVRDISRVQTWTACQDRFRTLPNARDVCQAVQDELLEMLRRAPGQ